MRGGIELPGVECFFVMAYTEKSNSFVAAVTTGSDRSSADVRKVLPCGEASCVEGCDGAELDDLSVTRLRQFFELLDRWDQQ